jgi:hypothetical protein
VCAQSVAGGDPTPRDQLYTLVREARRRGWWHEFADVYPPGSDTLYGLEDAAATIQVHSPGLVPGLLQIEGYARALIASANADDTVTRRRVELRMRRQPVLDRPDPPTVHALIDEAVLHRAIGGPAVLLKQLEALLAAAHRPNVVVQVIEFDAGAYPAAGVPFSMFHFDIPTVAPVAYQEQLTANTYIDNPGELNAFDAAWRGALAVATGPQRSRHLLTTHLDNLRSHG